jgi:hypothetical protein
VAVATLHDARLYHSHPMLIVGKDKSELVAHLPKRYLIVDDGDLIDRITLPKRAKVIELDLTKHSFNPLKGMDYKRARDFADILYSASPQGENTLTVRNGKRALTRMLLKATRLDNLRGDPKDPAEAEALATVSDILLSPVLNRFLLNPTNFSFDGVLLVRLDRTTLHPFDCFVLANLLISRYQGHVVVPDFGFYGCPFHVSLIRQKRLSAGVNFLDETKLKNHLLLLEPKLAGGCTADDAETLADYCSGFPRGTDGYSSYIAQAMK